MDIYGLKQKLEIMHDRKRYDFGDQRVREYNEMKEYAKNHQYDRVQSLADTMRGSYLLWRGYEMAMCDVESVVNDFIHFEVEGNERHNNIDSNPSDIRSADDWQCPYLVAFKRLGEGGGKTYRKINEKGEQR